MICSPFSISIVREITLCLGGKPTLLPTLKAVNDECSLFPTPLWSQSFTQTRLGYSDAPALNFDGEKQGGGGWWLSQWQQWIPRSSSFRFSSGAWSVWRQCQWGTRHAQHQPVFRSSGIMSLPGALSLVQSFSVDLAIVQSPWPPPISDPGSSASQVILRTSQNPILLKSAKDNFWHLQLRR